MPRASGASSTPCACDVFATVVTGSPAFAGDDGGAGAGDRKMKLAIPDMISNSYFPAIAAIELGFFKQEGLDVAMEMIYPVDKCYAAMRDGAVDFVGGSAHSALSAFPEWQGVKLIGAQAQGMYWFLILHKDFGARRGDISAAKGRRIGAANLVQDGEPDRTST